MLQMNGQRIFLDCRTGFVMMCNVYLYERTPAMNDSQKPKCILEIVNPDDILVVGLNSKWFRTFTSNSGKYPLKLEVPSEFLIPGWNCLSADYTNVALEGKNDAEVEYRLLLDDNEVVHVIYRTEVKPQTFTVHFNDTFSSTAVGIDMGESDGKDKSRFNDLMAWGDDQQKS